MPKKTTAPFDKDSIVDAALALAARTPWENVTLADIAKKAKCSLSALAGVFEDKADIMAAYGRRVDQETLASSATGDDESPRDRLFAVLMDRFDVLNRDRAAVLSILGSFKSDPAQAAITLPHLARSMAWMLEGAGIPAKGWRGAAYVAGLSALYLFVLRTWVEDEGGDLPKTMAALDSALNRAETLVGFIHRGS